MTATQSFSFVQITDIHVGFTGLTDYVKVLREDLRQIEREVGDRASFMVATGDLTNIGSEEECKMYLDAIRDCRLKIHPVVGNHDYVGGPWQEGRWDAAWYRKLIAPLNYAFDFGGVHFVSYDYTNEEPSSEPKQLQFDKLKQTPSRWLLDHLAAQPKNVPIILLVHYPLDSVFYNELKAFPIAASISGHWHSSRLYHDGRIEHFNGPSLCFGGIDYSPRAYRVFTWDGERLKCETVPLKRSPARAEGNTKSSAILWKAPLNGEVHLGSPVANGGRVFQGLMDESHSRNGAVACWDAQSGRELWRTPLAASVKNAPELSGDKLFVVTVTGEVVSLDARDGGRLWAYQLGDPSQRWMFSSPTAHNGSIFVGQGPHFAALDASTGKPRWVRTDLTQSDWISSYVSPACDGESVFIGFNWQAHSFHALDAKTGKTKWQLKNDTVSVWPVSTPVLDSRGGLYAMLQSGHVSKFDATTGALQWEFKHGDGWSPSVPCFEDDCVYAASGTGKLFSLDASTGLERWSWECEDDLVAMHPYRRSGKTIVSSPRVMGNVVLVGSNDGRLVALDKRTGSMTWSHDFGQPVSSSPAIADGKVFLASRDGWLYAFDATQIKAS